MLNYRYLQTNKNTYTLNQHELVNSKFEIRKNAICYSYCRFVNRMQFLNQKKKSKKIERERDY